MAAAMVWAKMPRNLLIYLRNDAASFVQFSLWLSFFLVVCCCCLSLPAMWLKRMRRAVGGRERVGFEEGLRWDRKAGGLGGGGFGFHNQTRSIPEKENDEMNIGDRSLWLLRVSFRIGPTASNAWPASFLWQCLFLSFFLLLYNIALSADILCGGGMEWTGEFVSNKWRHILVLLLLLLFFYFLFLLLFFRFSVLLVRALRFYFASFGTGVLYLHFIFMVFMSFPCANNHCVGLVWFASDTYFIMNERTDLRQLILNGWENGAVVGEAEQLYAGWRWIIKARGKNGLWAIIGFAAFYAKIFFFDGRRRSLKIIIIFPSE